ncbi:MAG: DUF202 domain-containing protein [Stackebrandtia sp.]
MTAPIRGVGAQFERTRLAWRRTALTATILSVFAIRLALQQGVSPPMVAVSALTALAWLGFLIGVQRRIRSLACDRPAPWKPPWPLLTSAAVIWFAALGAVLTLRGT